MISILLFLLFAQQNPNTSNIVVASADGTVNVLPPLDPATDSKPAIQSAIDWCESHPGRETLRLPPGTWKLGSQIELVSDIEIVGELVELTPLDPAAFQKTLLVAGASGQGQGTRARADNVSIVGMTLNQTAATSASCHCLFCDVGDDWRLTRVTAKNSKHEGLVSGGATQRWIWDRCEAYDCGAGSSFRTWSGAGINGNGHGHVFKKCKTFRCGQGYEHAGSKATFIECEANDGLPVVGGPFVGPAVGYNLGNGVMGIYRPRLIDCKSTGHPWAITFGNNIGRASGAAIDGFESENGGISFSLGRRQNNVSGDWDGPADEPIYLSRVHLKFTQPSDGPFIWNTGNGVPDWNTYTLAPTYAQDCVVEFAGVSPAQQGAPPFGVAGSTNGAPVHLIRCSVKGLDVAPGRGDFQQFLFGTNASATSAHLKTINCSATTSTGVARWFKSLRDSPE